MEESLKLRFDAIFDSIFEKEFIKEENKTFILWSFLDGTKIVKVFKFSGIAKVHDQIVWAPFIMENSKFFEGQIRNHKEEHYTIVNYLKEKLSKKLKVQIEHVDYILACEVV